MKSFFSTHRVERPLLVVLLLAIGGGLYYTEWYHRQTLATSTIHEQAKDSSTIQALAPRPKSSRRFVRTPERWNANNKHWKKKSYKPYPKSRSVQRPTQRFSFDPNSLSVDSFELLGCPHWLAKRIDKYRQKGGHFRKTEDLAKIYGFPPELYEDVKAYIVLPAAPAKKITRTTSSQNKLEKPARVIDINSATAEEFKTLRGIGTAYARRIIRYREKLGGFYALNQLQEVYGVSDSLYAQIQPFLVCAPTKIQRLNINTADLKTLGQHPYISWEQARSIIDYRREEGDIPQLEWLKILPHWEGESFRKARLYLSTEELAKP